MPLVNRARQARDPEPCDRCGKPTRSPYGVCARTADCNAEYGRRDRAAPHGSDTTAPCDICGKPTQSKLGVCMNTPDCRREYRVRYKPQKALQRKAKAAAAEAAREPLPTCTVCGQPVSRKQLPPDLLTNSGVPQREVQGLRRPLES